MIELIMRLSVILAIQYFIFVVKGQECLKQGQCLDSLLVSTANQINQTACLDLCKKVNLMRLLCFSQFDFSNLLLVGGRL